MFQFVQSAVRQGCEANLSFDATSITFTFYTKLKHHHREASFKISSKQNIKDGAPTGNRTPIPALKKINKQTKKNTKTQRRTERQA